MLSKKVYVNDQHIGEARTWTEVHELIKRLGILFVDKPGAAEGPSGFFISGSVTRRRASEAAQQRATIKPTKRD